MPVSHNSLPLVYVYIMQLYINSFSELYNHLVGPCQRGLNWSINWIEYTQVKNELTFFVNTYRNTCVYLLHLSISSELSPQSLMWLHLSDSRIHRQFLHWNWLLLQGSSQPIGRKKYTLEQKWWHTNTFIWIINAMLPNVKFQVA